MSTESTETPTPAPETPPAAPAAPATAAAPAPPPAAPAPPPTPEDIRVPPEYFRTLLAAQNRLAEIEVEKQRAEREKEEARALHMAEQGKHKEAIEAMRTAKEKEVKDLQGTIATMQAQTKKWVLEGELARALSSHNLMPGAAAKLTKLWQDEFEVRAENGRYVVQTPTTLESPAAFVNRLLASDEFGYFVKAQVPHTPSQPTQPSSPSLAAPPAPGTAPPAETLPPDATLGEAICWGIEHGAIPRVGSGGAKPATSDMSQGFALRRAKTA